MLTLFRGPAMWLSQEDADKIDVADNDWLEVYNKHGVVACRAAVSHRIHPASRSSTTPRTGT
ncbi:MAG: molybdopterin dinucleotide binding domain-containing protein [Solirubrobacterales bacterium]